MSAPGRSPTSPRQRYSTARFQVTRKQLARPRAELHSSGSPSAQTVADAFSSCAGVQHHQQGSRAQDLRGPGRSKRNTKIATNHHHRVSFAILRFEDIEKTATAPWGTRGERRAHGAPFLAVTRPLWSCSKKTPVPGRICVFDV